MIKYIKERVENYDISASTLAKWRSSFELYSHLTEQHVGVKPTPPTWKDGMLS